MMKPVFFRGWALPAFFMLLILAACSDPFLDLSIRFDGLAGLQQGDPVYFEGTRVGEVEKITYTREGDYLVDIAIVREFANAATIDTQFLITLDPAETGGKAVVLVQKVAGGEVLAEGSVVQGTIRSGFLEQFFGELQKQTGAAESELREALEQLQKSLGETSRRLDTEMERTLDDISDQLQEFKENMQRVPESREVQKLQESIRRFAEEFDRAQKEVRAHIRQEVLPELRRQLEELRGRLEKEGREGELDEIDRQLQEVDMV